jgi:hypothetical protein
MSNPVMAALAQAKVAEEREAEQMLNAATCAHLGVPVPAGDTSGEWKTWRAFCDKQGIRACPALPAAVAVYVLNHGHLGERLLKIVESIAAVHVAAGLADPCRSDVIITALAKVAPIEPPKTWDKAHAIMFARLPRDLQLYINKRAAEDSKAVRNAQNRKAKPNEQSTATADTSAA